MDRLIFEFEKNDYLVNKELYKIYVMGDDDAMGLTLEKAEGCEIEWKSGKNPCVKVLRKKSKKTGKMMTKEEQQDSFFDFFSPPEVGFCSKTVFAWYCNRLNSNVRFFSNRSLKSRRMKEKLSNCGNFWKKTTA